MKILHLADFGPTSLGTGTGIYKVVTTLCEGQNRMGHQSRIFLINKNEVAAKGENISLTTSFSTFKTLLKEYDPDIVIFHSVHKPIYLRIYRELMRLGIPYCIEFHGAASYENSQKGKYKKLIANYLGFNRFVRNAASVIYLNKQELEDSIFHRLNPKYMIIPNGIHPLEEGSITKPEEGKLTILYLGRIDENHKGLDVLVRAIDILEKEGWAEKIHFDFYGVEDNPGNFLEDIKHHPEIATYHGPVFGEAKNEVYARSHIYILTSRYEGMPLTIFEALAYGCPCLVTPYTNCGEFLTEEGCGWLTDLDPEDIALKIKDAYNEYRQIGPELVREAMRASRIYDWDEIVRTTLKEYSNVIAE